MKRFAILGHPVAHSLSPQFHNEQFKKLGLKNYVYEWCDTPPDEWRDERSAAKEPALCGPVAEDSETETSRILRSSRSRRAKSPLKKLEGVIQEMREGKWQGFSVTIPHKETVIKFLDKISPLAKKVGAVNTIIRQEDGTLFGDNTDYVGFQKALEEAGVNPKKALILGTGGASKAVIAVLKDQGVKITVASRTERPGAIMYDELEPNGEFELIVNTTPVGMSPDIDSSPITDPKWFRKDRTYFDMIYVPTMTKFLKLAKKAGGKIITGDRMFYFQALEQSKIFSA